jgi:hypothetical protein
VKELQNRKSLCPRATIGGKPPRRATGLKHEPLYGDFVCGTLYGGEINIHLCFKYTKEVESIV